MHLNAPPAATTPTPAAPASGAELQALVDNSIALVQEKHPAFSTDDLYAALDIASSEGNVPFGSEDVLRGADALVTARANPGREVQVRPLGPPMFVFAPEFLPTAPDVSWENGRSSIIAWPKD